MKPLTGFALILLFTLQACSRKEKADAIFYNAKVYTVNEKSSVEEAFAIKDGKILAVGNSSDVLGRFSSENMNDLQGSTVYPGFIDAHCHFYGYGVSLRKADLSGTGSFQEVLRRVLEFSKDLRGEWVLGRGWDQNDWDEKAFPDKKLLDSLFPDRPVFLQRIDGHAALVNQAALDRAGITPRSVIKGGEIVKKDGIPTGVLIDNAADSVERAIPRASRVEMEEALLRAQERCFEVGLTTVDDAGLEKEVVDIIDSLQKAGKLKMKVYVMLNPSEKNKAYYFRNGKYKTDRLNVCSFKVYADGALGSRGACLLKTYSDKPEHKGFLLHDTAYFSDLASTLAGKKFQMNTHCIGDSANRYILKLYGKTLKGKNDLRWRIEHAQVVDSADFGKFGQFSVIPSVQPTHATSDMYWAKDRLGDRVVNAYAYRRLMEENGMVALGSDFPVESINPLFGFYAAVVRKDQKGFPSGGFQPAEALSREQALKGMTIWAAYSNFEEMEKGSLEPGKSADFVVLGEDIMKSSAQDLWKIKIKETYINGEKVFTGR
jgi:predicted amidohydrolase YtcJ